MHYDSQTQIRNKVKECVNKAIEVYGQDIPIPEITFSNRMTKCAGVYACRVRRPIMAESAYRLSFPSSVRKSATIIQGQPFGHKITFSSPIIRDNPLEDFMADTVVHEVAHMVDRIVHGSTGHNARFYGVMRKLGNTNPTRCHSYKVSSIGKRFSYSCSTCGKEIELSTVRHNRVLQGAKYTHRCENGGKGRLTLNG